MRSVLFVMAALVAVAAPVAAAEALPSTPASDCIVLWDFPDEGLALCTGNPNCPLGLSIRRTTFLGTEEHCVL